MDRQKMLDEMASVRLGVTRRVRETIDLILQLAEQYRYLGKNFTFSFNDDLDTQVNQMLIALSDDIKDDNDTKVLAAILLAIDDEDVDEDDVMDYINREQGGETRVERFDMYCTRLRRLLEAWIAIAFANNLTQGQLRTEIFSNFGNPFASELWRKAEEEGGYMTSFIVSDTQGFGKGIPRNIIDGLTLTAQNAINEAFQYAVLLSYAEKGNVIGYRVHRGSTYHCPQCDSLCEGIHPLTEMVLPAHPRCCCYTTPVFLNGDEG